MTEEKNEPFKIDTLQTVLEKEIQSWFTKYCSDQAFAAGQQGKTLSIAPYINAQKIETLLERIIPKLGGGVLELGRVFVSVKDNNGGFVTPGSDCDKIIVLVAYGQKFIINNKEYPPGGNRAETKKSPPVSGKSNPKPQPGAVPAKAPKPAAKADGKPANKQPLTDDQIRDIQILFAKELKRKLDELWINREGLGVDFNNPGALKIELLQDSPRIDKILQVIGEKTLDISIDKETGLVKLYAGGKTSLQWLPPGMKHKQK